MAEQLVGPIDKVYLNDPTVAAACQFRRRRVLTGVEPGSVAGMTWLLCDYGEVLCLAPTAGDRARLAEAAGWDLDRGDFWDAYWVDRRAYDRADLSVEEYWSRMLGYPPAPAHLQRLMAADAASWVHPNPASLAAAQRAAGRGLQLAILSNAPVEVARAIDAAPWLASFSRRFFSCRLRAVKPEPAAYHAVLTALGAQAADVVFFDDKPANVAGAIALGIDARLFEDPAQLDELATR
jgi:putative hydrolase of the HAD superfamily